MKLTGYSDGGISCRRRCRTPDSALHRPGRRPPYGGGITAGRGGGRGIDISLLTCSGSARARAVANAPCRQSAGRAIRRRRIMRGRNQPDRDHAAPDADPRLRFARTEEGDGGMGPCGSSSMVAMERCRWSVVAPGTRGAWTFTCARKRAPGPAWIVSLGLARPTATSTVGRPAGTRRGRWPGIDDDGVDWSSRRARECNRVRARGPGGDMTKNLS